jgi:hypothetical protein
MAAQPPVRLWTEVSAEGNLWTVVPHVEAPPGSALRYEIVVRKTGHSGRSDTRQSGQFAVGNDGARSLASLRIGVGAEDQCDVDVKVFAEAELAADLTVHLPR